MALFNKDKMLNTLGKAVDKVNGTADKAVQYAKDKEWDKKAENIKNKTTGFVKEHDIDKAAESVAGAIGTGLKKAGEGIGKAGEYLEKTMNEKKSESQGNWGTTGTGTTEEGTWRPVSDDRKDPAEDIFEEEPFTAPKQATETGSFEMPKQSAETGSFETAGNGQETE